MADIYLSSVDGSDASDGLSWANAKATLAAALTAAGAGGRVFVDHAHAESQASNMTLASPGTVSSPVQVLCVDRTGNPEPPTALATTATVTTTGNSSITTSGYAYSAGVSYRCGSGAVSPSINIGSGTGVWWIEDATLEIVATGGSAAIAQISGSNNGGWRWRDVTVKFAAATQGIEIRNEQFDWRGGSVDAAGTIPTTLFLRGNSHRTLNVFGVDLSALGSGKNLVNIVGDHGGYARIENCKLGASVTITEGAHPGEFGMTVELVNCDSADTNYLYCKKTYQGEITHESTIVRTGGASDGTTPISRKLVSSANAKFYSPLVLDSVVLWNDDTGAAKTVTVEIVTDNVTLTDAECWVEVEYLGTAGFPVSSFAHDRAAEILATPANQASSTEAWTTTGLATPIKQKLSVSFTPQEKGPVRVRVMLAKPSTTVYVDPPTELT